MNIDDIIELIDNESRIRAFGNCLAKLEHFPRLDLDSLKLCIKLRPCLSRQPQQLEESEPMVEASAFTEKLCHLVLLRLPHEQLHSDHIYKLAEILCSDGPFANRLFRDKIYSSLVTALPLLSGTTHTDVEESNEVDGSMHHAVRTAKAHLTLLKCSFWLPSNSNHVVDPGMLALLSRFVGLSLLEEVALDAISAFLSLLKRKELIVVAPPTNTVQSWLKVDLVSGQMVLSNPLVDISLWNRLAMLEPKHYMTRTTSSKLFRTWFQWVSQIVADGVYLECLQQSSYWERVRIGLLYGHADQRKYCFGIIRQSLLAAQSDISTPTMQFSISERMVYLKVYEQYLAVFETIVLDRYTNQVQACLPELSKVFQSMITPVMATTLLSAALDSTVQESVRKIIGNWYMQYVVKSENNAVPDVDFLVKGFLPWAATGDLFTTTLISTRDNTFSSHGASLAAVIAIFVKNSPDIHIPRAARERDTGEERALKTNRRAIIVGTLDFILNAKGRLFHYSILYLLEGLVKGLRACCDEVVLQEPLAQPEIDKVFQISRLPGLPEVASDLYCDYCCQLCDLVSPGWRSFDMPSYRQLLHHAKRLMKPIDSSNTIDVLRSELPDPSPLEALRKRLEGSKHLCIQGDSYAPMCRDLIDILNQTDPFSVVHEDLYAIVDAFWEEADRRQFCRSVAVHVPSVLFHPTCTQVCILQGSNRKEELIKNSFQNLLSRAIYRLQQLSEGRTYILSLLATQLRKASFSYPGLISILPIEDYILHFLNTSPTTKTEFLFEIAAAEKLHQHQPHRTYEEYYGKREWHAYAAIIDLLQRFPVQQSRIAKQVLDRLLEPWKTQLVGIPIISKWKNVFQLQAMLILAEFCIPASEVDVYLASFQHALVLEAWPRYRFLLEWIITRIYYRFPGKTSHILKDLSHLADNSSTHIASLMKIAVLVAPRETEHFSATFMTQLVPFAASPKVHIRHESNYAIPIIFDLALSRDWKSITENQAFVNLNAFIRRLDKFQSVPWTIRTLKLDASKDFTLSHIFQGQYLSIESPEKQQVAHEDFIALLDTDRASGIDIPPERIPLGQLTNTATGEKSTKKILQHVLGSDSQVSPAFFQTKSGFDIESLYPRSGLPSAQDERPASVILVASLIENPTNIGGLSRISESFGIEALIIDDLKRVTHKDFRATSVTSEKHFPIHEVKATHVPEFLLDMKRSGYEILGIEQTDQSGILGVNPEFARNQNLGNLPKNCVLVLGSEKGGITAEVLAAIDRCVEIRTVGVTRSLNVQTAGAIALYEWWREWFGKV